MSNEIKVNIINRPPHRRLEKSTTLNRQYVKKPQTLTTPNPHISTAKALKEAAVDRALREMPAPKLYLRRSKGRGKRLIIAFIVSTTVMLVLAMFVRINLPNISVRVAAAQTGIEASYPNFIPRDFSLTGVYTNNNNSVVIDFKGPDNKEFTLSEEKSPWDSTALQNNYVKSAYGKNYDTIREQGITIYISHSNAAWVNRGIFYKITATPNTLSKSQIKHIATSL